MCSRSSSTLHGLCFPVSSLARASCLFVSSSLCCLAFACTAQPTTATTVSNQELMLGSLDSTSMMCLNYA